MSEKEIKTREVLKKNSKGDTWVELVTYTDGTKEARFWDVPPYLTPHKGEWTSGFTNNKE